MGTKNTVQRNWNKQLMSIRDKISNKKSVHRRTHQMGTKNTVQRNWNKELMSIRDKI